ncbi:hypothetical protein BMETH_525_0 [methanotrophic bacterial endosymbiont of Bathymodiolus sp.]|nr:hypothetical protein BMETH_525_0 [methanotrophic bacterial endosymbiont of Bathymodiolus sp.]
MQEKSVLSLIQERILVTNGQEVAPFRHKKPIPKMLSAYQNLLYHQLTYIKQHRMVGLTRK